MASWASFHGSGGDGGGDGRGRRSFQAPPSPAATHARSGTRRSGEPHDGGPLQELGVPHPGLAAAPRGDAVAAVLLQVAVEVVGAHEGLKAAGALVGPQAGVDAHVVLQVIVVSERSSALGTQVRLLTCVLAHVNLELVLPVDTCTEKDRKTRSRPGPGHKIIHPSIHPHPHPHPFMTTGQHTGLKEEATDALAINLSCQTSDLQLNTLEVNCIQND